MHIKTIAGLSGRALLPAIRHPGDAIYAVILVATRAFGARGLLCPAACWPPLCAGVFRTASCVIAGAGR